MYKIIWSFNDTQNEISFDNPKEANEAWRLLKYTPGVSGMKAVMPEKKHNVVRVVFPGGVKEYTYLTHKPVPKGGLVVVEGLDGDKVVKVVSSDEMTDSELAKICPLAKFKYVIGVVVAA